MKKALVFLMMMMPLMTMAQGKAKVGENFTFTANGVSFTMVFIKGGTFTMGATEEQGDEAYDDEKPAHSETVGDYWLGETEVTQELWKAVMGTTPALFTGDTNPVDRVSWDECQEFVKKLSRMVSSQLPKGHKFRLPTEAEWEYAARGGELSHNYKYPGGDNVDELAWYDDNSKAWTHPVKTKKPNELGLYDMTGNVCEWCQDNWSNSYEASPNPERRVRRGGSYHGTARLCRVSIRGWNKPDMQGDYLGLRLAL